MKRYIYILIGLAAAFTIYYLYQRNTVDPVTDEPVKEAVEGQTEPQAPAEETTTADTEAGKTELKPSDVFSDSPSGKSISKVIELYGELDAPESANGKEAHAELQKLFDTPNQAFEEIKRGALILPTSMEIQKQFLLQFSSLLKVDKTEKMNFLDRAFKNTISKSVNSTDFQVRKTPVIVFETYCKVAEDKKVCTELLNGSIGSAPKDVQISLLNAYKRVDMDGARELAKKLEINIY